MCNMALPASRLALVLLSTLQVLVFVFFGSFFSFPLTLVVLFIATGMTMAPSSWVAFAVLSSSAALSLLYPDLQLSSYLVFFGLVVFSLGVEKHITRALSRRSTLALLSVVWVDVTVVSSAVLSSQAETNALSSAYLIIRLFSSAVFLGLFFKESSSRPESAPTQQYIKVEPGVSLFWLGFYFFLMSISYVSISASTKSINTDVAVFFSAVFSVSCVVLRLSYRPFIRVWIQKNIKKTKFDYRQVWVDVMDNLSSAVGVEQAMTYGLTCMRDNLAAENVGLFSWDGDTVKALRSEGLDLPESAIKSLQLIKHYSAEHQWVVNLFELQTQPGRYPGFPPELPHRWQEGWFLVPVALREQTPAFFLIKNSQVLSSGIDWETKDFAIALAKQIWYHCSSEVDRQKLTEQAQFIAFYQTSAFVVHDLKNIDAQLGMILENAVEHGGDLDFAQDVYKTLGSIHKRLNKTLSQLKAKTHHERHQGVSVDEWLKGMVSKAKVRGGTLFIDGDKDSVELCHPQLKTVLSHLVDNAIEATEKVPLPFVELIFSKREDGVKITIRDNGVGMTEDFLKKNLFKPFVTTKGNAGMGLGLFEAKQFVTEQGGSINVESQNGKGTTFMLSLPFLA